MKYIGSVYGDHNSLLHYTNCVLIPGYEVISLDFFLGLQGNWWCSRNIYKKWSFKTKLYYVEIEWFIGQTKRLAKWRSMFWKGIWLPYV